VEHSKDVYEPVLRVPLIVKPVREHGSGIEESPISLLDVNALIFEIMERSAVDIEWAAPLRHYEPFQHPVISELYYSRTKDLFDPVWGQRFDRIRTAVFDPPFKYIASSDGENELYNLEDDRFESRNLLATDPERAQAMAARLIEFFAVRDAADMSTMPDSLSEDHLRRLKSLGY